MTKRHIWPRGDRYVVEACPLHTERPDWAKLAPSQLAAACARGAHVITFTEVHGSLVAELASVAEQHGYKFYHGAGDTALAWRADLKDISFGSAPIAGSRGYAWISHRFYRRTVKVFAFHWATNKPEHQATRDAQTRALVDVMDEASRSFNISFFGADTNPSRPLRDSQGEPQASLAKAGILIVYRELGEYPPGAGVTTIGRNSRDTAVKAVSVVLQDPLGSDHHPATATYSIRRRRLPWTK